MRGDQRALVLPNGRFGVPGTVIWHVSAAILVILLPAWLRLGGPYWELPPEMVPGLLLPGIGYLAAALTWEVGVGWASRAGNHGEGASSALRHLIVLAGTGLCFPVLGAIALLRPDLPISRLGLLMAWMIGLVLVVLPRFLGPLRRVGLAVVSGAAIALTVVGFIRAQPLPPPAFGFERGADRPFVASNEQLLQLRYHYEVVGSQSVRGGALDSLNDGFLLATGSGELYQLTWDVAADTLWAEPLAGRVPVNREDFIADQVEQGFGAYFRVADVMIDNAVTPRELYVSHHYWSSEDQCFTLRVSRVPLESVLEAEQGASLEWHTAFETQPCLPVTERFVDVIQAGGRLAQTADGRLLLSVGDHGFDGVGVALANHPQDPDTDYGKILWLDGEGGREVMALGLRNPQGMALDDEGRVWVSDQGPEGGDELNLIEAGANYGWPYYTHGTQYQMTSWPYFEEEEEEGAAEYAASSYVWVPSPALSGLVHVQSPLFPNWDGNLLATSLRAQSLFRVVLQGDRVVFVEPIEVGRRIRDIAIGEDGRIVLWTEIGDIVTIRPAETSSSGEAVYAQCATCHQTNESGVATAPDLRGIVDRPVAADPTFQYSPALRAMDGSWDLVRLEAYIRNPAGFVPGTSMVLGGTLSDEQIRLLLDFLRNYD